ncbi:unnamed protein product, partial [Mesorhabditis belari]|uniref:Uncharacterized protein n=1 Tax=Mesorhabditis belari TaxID=2138241 RepID=A0AAF3ECD9_9BILA
MNSHSNHFIYALQKASASDEPPFLKVGTEVSAKFKGAFCEAKVKRIFKNIKFRVMPDESSTGTLVVEESHFKGDPIYELNQIVDYSTMGAKHYNEEHSLDALPLYNPEQFSSPVVAKIIKKNKVDKRDREARQGAGTSKKERVVEQHDVNSDDEKPSSSSTTTSRETVRQERAATHAASGALADQHGGLSPSDEQKVCAKGKWKKVLMRMKLEAVGTEWRQSLPLKKKKEEETNENEEEESDDDTEIHKETFASLRKTTMKAIEIHGSSFSAGTKCWSKPYGSEGIHFEIFKEQCPLHAHAICSNSRLPHTFSVVWKRKRRRKTYLQSARIFIGSNKDKIN